MGGLGLELTMCSDGDYVDKSNDRRSVSGTAVTLGGAPVSCASTTQSVLLCPQQRQNTSL